MRIGRSIADGTYSIYSNWRQVRCAELRAEHHPGHGGGGEGRRRGGGGRVLHGRRERPVAHQVLPRLLPAPRRPARQGRHTYPLHQGSSTVDEYRCTVQGSYRRIQDRCIITKPGFLRHTHLSTRTCTHCQQTLHEGYGGPAEAEGRDDVGGRDPPAAPGHPHPPAHARHGRRWRRELAGGGRGGCEHCRRRGGQHEWHDLSALDGRSRRRAREDAARHRCAIANSLHYTFHNIAFVLLC